VVAQVPDPPPLPVGQVVLHVSEPKHKVPIEPFVNTPVVANNDVEVPFVVVEFNPVKFWRVVEPVCKVFEKVVCPAVTLRVLGKVYAPAPNVPAVTSDAGTAPLERVPIAVRDEVTTVALRVVPVRVPAGAVPEIFPVKLPVRLPVPLVKKRLVVLAVVEKSVPAKKLVEVELVVVEFNPVKF